MNKRRITTVLALICIVLGLNAQSLKIASYNIRNDNQDDVRNGNGWQKRYPYLCDLVKYHDFDIFGIQEGFHHQLEDIKQRIPGMDYVGVGRDDGDKEGEYSAIIYKTDKFNLVDKGNFWLAENSVLPVLGWDAACIRICSWGKFRMKESGREFYFFNMHADHIGTVARSEGVKLVLSKIREIAGGKPAVLTGDFNVNQFDESYTLLNVSGILRDSYELTASAPYANNGTFNNFEVNQKSNDRIDHIFLTKDFKVKDYGILTDLYWDQDGQARVPSDHYPVVIDVDFK